MPVLLDTGILLRLLHRGDPLNPITRSAVRTLKDRREQTVTTLQNISEFWNVCTRPQTARGGLGLTFEQSERRLRLLERFVTVLPEPADLYQRWRQLIIAHRILGVQVHDAKLVAAMGLHGINQILTLNGRDFSRYPEITALAPENL
jgi:predicted nucleic acid-binding protein